MSTTVAKPKAASTPKPVSCIPIAGFRDVYDLPSVEKALQELSPGANEALRIGMKLEVCFEDVGDGVCVPKFRPAAD
jgi:hypothetical protein